MLHIDDLAVSYGMVRALRGVSISVAAGEMVGVIGANGAGKSTLLRTITGLIKPDSGTISFEGESLVGVAPETIVRRGISHVPEGRHIFASLTVAENLRMGATIRNDRSGIDADIEKMLQLFPAIRPYFNSSAGTLSGGEQQMLAIARGLLSRPRLLMLDEPSLGLAPIVVDQVFDALEELKSQGVTILLIEQNAARTVEIADRVYVLRTGLVELEGTAAELASSADFESLYLGR